MTEREAHDFLKGTKKQEKNELLFRQFSVNYKKDLLDMFRQGSCVLKAEVEHTMKCTIDENGNPVKRLRRKVKFWTGHQQNQSNPERLRVYNWLPIGEQAS